MAQSHPAPPDDPTVYPVSDDMGTSTFENLLRELLRPLLRRFLAEQGRPMFVGTDQFIYWEQYNPSRCVAPDLYTCPVLAPSACPDSLKLWLLPPGAAPPFALESVSENKGKDYVRSPRRYEELGTRELVIYDPLFEHRKGDHRWQVYRRKNGKFGRATVSNEDRVASRELGCWLRVVEVEGQPLLRLATGPAGDTLFPTAEEAERAAKEAERAAKEAAEATAARERQQREAAEARVRELEALLARTR